MLMSAQSLKKLMCKASAQDYLRWYEMGKIDMI